jgi:hypothetical protein
MKPIRHRDQVKPRQAKNPRQICPKCGKFYLRSVYIDYWGGHSDRRNQGRGYQGTKSIGKWCRGCHYFESTIPLQDVK